MIVLMSWRPSIQQIARHWSGVTVTPPSCCDDVVVAQVRHALERAELVEDELPLVEPAHAFHDHRLDVHLDEDVVVDLLVGLEGELAFAPAEEVERRVLDLGADGALERGPVDVAVLEQDLADAALLVGLRLLDERLLELLAGDVARLHETLAERHGAGLAEGEVDQPGLEEDLARLLLALDRERAGLGAHLHELEHVGKAELSQVALQEHPRLSSRRPGRSSAGDRTRHRTRRPTARRFVIGNTGPELSLARPRRESYSMSLGPSRPTSRLTPPARACRPRRRPSTRRPRGRRAGRVAGGGGAAAGGATAARRRSSSAATRPVASVAAPPSASAQRGPKPPARRPASGPPSGVLPKKTTPQRAITRPRIVGSLLSCSSELVVATKTTAAMPIGTRATSAHVEIGRGGDRSVKAPKRQRRGDEQALRRARTARRQQRRRRERRCPSPWSARRRCRRRDSNENFASSGSRTAKL